MFQLIVWIIIIAAVIVAVIAGIQRAAGRRVRFAVMFPIFVGLVGLMVLVRIVIPVLGFTYLLSHRQTKSNEIVLRRTISPDRARQAWGSFNYQPRQWAIILVHAIWTT